MSVDGVAHGMSAQAAARRPFFRRRKTCPFSGANAPKIDYKDVQAAAALRVRARQDRAEPHHRGVGQEAARAGAGDQARALPRPAALRDPVGGTAEYDGRGRPAADGWGGRDPPLTATDQLIRAAAGQLDDDADRSHRHWAPAPRRRCCSRRSRPARSLSILLFYLAPLPIMIAGARLEPLAGLIAALSCAAGALGAHVRRLVLPAPSWSASACRPGGSAISRCWRGRPRPTARRHVEWYPVGRLVLWAAVLGALIVVGRHSQFRHRRGELPGRHARARSSSRLRSDRQAPPTQPRHARHRRLRTPARLPGAGACRRRPPCVATLTNVINLWLAGAHRANSRAGLQRPWPDLAGDDVSAVGCAPVLVGAAVAVAFVPGLARHASPSVLAASLADGLCASLGFAVLHAITRGIGARAVRAGRHLCGRRPVRLAGAGHVRCSALLDAALDLRGRVAARRPPPSIRT